MECHLSTGARQQLDRFCRQYLQVTPDLDYPAEEYLRNDAFQQLIYWSLFSENVKHQPPPRYQLRVLKKLVARIEKSIQDWDSEGLSDDLMDSLSPLLATSMPSETSAAQQKAYVTYTLAFLSHTLNPVPIIAIHEARSMLAAAGTTGLRTWEAGLHLGNYLCANPEIVRGKSILELGSGTGYVSILCAKYLGAAHVLATDGDDDVVASFSTNFCLNDLQDCSKIEGKELKWGHALTGGEHAQWNFERNVDLVIGADLTYDPRNIPPLLSTTGDIFALYPEVKILMAATVRNEQTSQKFPDACKQNNFRFEEIRFEVPRAELQEGPFYTDQAPIQLSLITKN